MSDLAEYLRKQMIWSGITFGQGRRTVGILEHIRKELIEIAADPADLSEWMDVLILALDGYWRHGGHPEMLMRDLEAKQTVNFARRWPAPQPEDQAVEHIRPMPSDTGV